MEKLSMEVALVEQLFRQQVGVSIEAIADYSDRLLPEEQAVVKSVVQKRREEFSTGRLCARKAIAKLPTCYQPQPLLPGKKREPLWPEGVVGSLSHSSECCIAVVADNKHIRSLGVDIEKREAIKPGVRDLICGEEELARLGEHRENPELWKLIFSAKESIYKALYPVVQQWIGCSHASLQFDFDNGRFYADMDDSLDFSDTSLHRLEGRFLLHKAYILTVVEIT